MSRSQGPPALRLVVAFLLREPKASRRTEPGPLPPGSPGARWPASSSSCSASCQTGLPSGPPCSHPPCSLGRQAPSSLRAPHVSLSALTTVLALQGPPTRPSSPSSRSQRCPPVATAQTPPCRASWAPRSPSAASTACAPISEFPLPILPRCSSPLSGCSTSFVPFVHAENTGMLPAAPPRQAAAVRLGVTCVFHVVCDGHASWL